MACLGVRFFFVLYFTIRSLPLDEFWRERECVKERETNKIK
jgi:hypothetical protein